MNLADELRKLQELHRNGALTDEEFAQGKALVLNAAASAPELGNRNTDPAALDLEQVLTPQRLRVLQILAAALLTGVISFLAVTLFLVHVQNNGQGLAPPRDLPVLSVVALVMLASCAPLAFVLPGIQTRSALQQIRRGTWQVPPRASPMDFTTDIARLLAVRQMTLLVGLALLEGPAFMGCVAYLMEAQPLALGVVGLAVVLMLGKFPTAERVRSWFERQAEVLAELRQQRDFAAE